MRVFILGLPGVGKTWFGKQLAELLVLPFIDLDATIERDAGKSIKEIFEQDGEDVFREQEAKNLRTTVQQNNSFVMATGGGTPAHEQNMAYMLKQGVCILVKDDIQQIANRISQDSAIRPMFLGQDATEIEKTLFALWRIRRTYYEQTHIITGVEAIQKPQLLTKRLELFTKKGNFLNDIIEID